MNRHIVWPVALIATALAACGGGGSTPGPLPTPVQTPTVQYAASLIFTGALGGQVQAAVREAQVRAPMISSTPIPIMVVEPPESGIDASAYGGTVQAVVSPLPSISPAVSFTQTNPAAQFLATPTPSGTPQPLPTGVIAEQIVAGTNSVQAQGSGTATATIGSPVNLSPSTPVYSYMSIALDCYGGPGGVAGGSSTPYTNHFGWQWSGSTWVADDDVSTADIYVDGPGCVANNPSETSATIHVPGGDVRLSTDTAFSAVSATQWTGTETAFSTDTSQGMLINPDGSINALIVGKTHDGSIFKMFPNTLGNGMFGAIEVSGDSVDGF